MFAAYPRSIMFCGVLLLHGAVYAQTCAQENPDAAITTPTEDFILHDNGTVTHITTGLTWMRCSLGQTWDGATCTGFPDSFNWEGSIARAMDVTFAGYSDWRVPTREELISLIEERCNAPAINSEVFPNTSSSRYWTSTPNLHSELSAWDVNFLNGYSSSYFRRLNYKVRLVRD